MKKRIIGAFFIAAGAAAVCWNLATDQPEVVYADHHGALPYTTSIIDQPVKSNPLVKETVILTVEETTKAFLQQLAAVTDNLNEDTYNHLTEAYIALDPLRQQQYSETVLRLGDNLEAELEAAAQEKAAAEKAAKAKAAAEAAAQKKAQEAEAARVTAALAAEKRQQEERAAAQQAAAEQVAQAAASAPVVTTPAPAAPAAVEVTPPPATNTIDIFGNLISIIDYQGAGAAPDNGCAGYWQGNGSTTDGLSTHIIGHNPGIFSCVMNLGVGSQITVTDRNGNARTYTVYAVMNVNDAGVDENGQNQWEKVVYQSGESISLQTCIDDYWNRMILAY